MTACRTNPPDVPFHAGTSAEVLVALGTDVEFGLSESDALARLEVHGPNPRVDEAGFDGRRKRMSTLHVGPEGYDRRRRQ